MNERIRQLADEATELAYETFDQYNHKTVKHYKFDKGKFAELIVRECVGIVEQYGTPDAFYIVDEINRVMLNIRPNKHFGVEE